MVVTATAPAPGAAAPASGWDTEVFVLRGGDRADLRDRVLSLAAAVEGQSAALPEIAAGLAAGLAPGGVRLSVVAGSAGDLVAKLRRAADRLADSKCQQ